MNLSNEQKKAISHVSGPALVLAVPGAGKTTVLIHRTGNLIFNHNVRPENILSITFSKASAKDMKERFNRTFGNKTQGPVHFSTIHSFAFGLIKEFAYNYNKRYTLIEDMNRKVNKINLLKRIYFAINKTYITEDKLESLINSIGYVKNMLLSPDEFLSNNKCDIKNFKDIFLTYEKHKQKNGLIDFDDMLTLALNILKKDKYLLNKYRNRYKYIQVDEGQDTSKVQMEIIKILSYPLNNLFIVADDDQSIYSFRGAYPKGLFEFQKKYKDCKIFFMEKNYRSSQNIVKMCNSFIKKNKLRYNKNISTENPFVEPISIINVKSASDQYEFLIDELKEHKDYKNTAILYRNNISSIGIIEYLERSNIPFYMRDVKVKFFNHWIVKDIIDFFTLAHNNSNTEVFENIYFKMNGFISKKQVSYIKTLDRNSSVFDRLLSIPGINDFYRRNFLNLEKDFKKLSKMRPYEGICHIEKILGYEDYLKENAMKFTHSFDSLRTILDCIKIISSNTSCNIQLMQRLDYLENICTDSKKEEKGITLSTIHSAKGLEFDRVYIIDLIEGDFPTISSIDGFNKGNVEILEEERRLFYVGMTRAKKSLTLLTAEDNNDKEVSSSRFIAELKNLKI